ncbi:MAG TPA: TIGR04282 family arsenosugar biosynthesis glycosyltransferase [Acidobacteriaceae bacterium]|nr:TIGR04282 family arsenosugar biosynthesis glycosyltransferase [Acidobacteriaceae bacterium]
MAKAPRPGKVKTRLAPPLTLEQSAALNICFLRDTTQNIHDVSTISKAAGLICYTPIGEESLFDGMLPQGFVLIPQRGDAFGERLLAAATDILSCGFAAVCLIDSDSPTVPAHAFHQAVEELLRPGDRIVLGGSDDGGYYLIGLKAPHAEPFTNISWSTSTVYKETTDRIAQAGIELIKLPNWYDVDDGATLNVLADELLHRKPPPFTSIPGYSAPHSRGFLSRLHEANQ